MGRAEASDFSSLLPSSLSWCQFSRDPREEEGISVFCLPFGPLFIHSTNITQCLALARYPAEYLGRRDAPDRGYPQTHVPGAPPWPEMSLFTQKFPSDLPIQAFPGRHSSAIPSPVSYSQ